MTQPGVQPMGGARPPYDDAGARTLAMARQRTQPRPPVLGAAERKQAGEAAAQQRHCVLCGGIHAMPSTAACPRLASFEFDGDGKVKSGTFWPGRKWAKGRVILAEDAQEDGSSEEAVGAG